MVAYPVAISLLLPVVSTSQPNLLESAMIRLPLIRDCMFSSRFPSQFP